MDPVSKSFLRSQRAKLKAEERERRRMMAAELRAQEHAIREAIRLAKIDLNPMSTPVPMPVDPKKAKRIYLKKKAEGPKWNPPPWHVPKKKAIIDQL